MVPQSLVIYKVLLHTPAHHHGVCARDTVGRTENSFVSFKYLPLPSG